MRREKLLFFFISILLLTSSHLVGQSSYVKTRQLPQVSAYEVTSEDDRIRFQSDSLFSAIVIKSTVLGTFSVIVGEMELNVPKDEDVETPTYFLSLPQPAKAITLVVPSKVTFELFTIQSGAAPSLGIQNARISETQDCQDPLDYIPQSTWRSGLQAPNFSRSFHEVFHNVVHHAAGSNSNTNYTQVVRDIYVYHTQVNGWSDIGYNYLISQDGTIYAGRDPGDGSQGDVRGAHFCGSNSNTLGVCLLGNYETATPTASTWESLEQLLTYQLLRQERGPFEVFSHRLGNLATIVGHRDGCSTLCPGENVYRQLEELKLSLAEQIADCVTPNQLSFEVSSDFLIAGKNVSFSNTSTSYDRYRWVLDGAFPSRVDGANATVKYSVPGFYDVMLIGTEGEVEDTLLLKGFMQVSLLKSTPVIFPNPAIGNELLNIDFEKEVKTVKLFETSGKLVSTWSDSAAVSLPQIEPGLYFLTILSDGKVYKKKLLIN